MLIIIVILIVAVFVLWSLRDDLIEKNNELQYLLEQEKQKTLSYKDKVNEEISSTNELLEKINCLLRRKVHPKTDGKTTKCDLNRLFDSPVSELIQHCNDLRLLLSSLQEYSQNKAVQSDHLVEDEQICKLTDSKHRIEILKKRELELNASIENKKEILNEANIFVKNELGKLAEHISLLNSLASTSKNKLSQKLEISPPSDFKDLIFDSLQTEIMLKELKQYIIDIIHERDINLKYKLLNDARQKSLDALLSSHKNSMPWIAGMISDYLTYDIEILAKKLEWGKSIERSKKVASIREIRAEAKRRIEEAKVATYQLEYLKELYPALEDVLDAEYKELNFTGDMPDYDPVRKYLEKDEWLLLSTTEKNQLALDRYVESRKKSKWQIGRDYELSVAFEYIKKGFEVDTHGSYMGLEDMGRDVIAKKDGTILLIQCKYWSKDKKIHEKHIFQLFGSIVSYCMENNCNKDNVKGVFVTNIELSSTARKVAEYLGVFVVEHHTMSDFPRIKCNIGHSEEGAVKIYHLPMDEQYDSAKIDKPGEFYAFTVKEAEKAGFRRAYKHIVK